AVEGQRQVLGTRFREVPAVEGLGEPDLGTVNQLDLDQVVRREAQPGVVDVGGVDRQAADPLCTEWCGDLAERQVVEVNLLAAARGEPVVQADERLGRVLGDGEVDTELNPGIGDGRPRALHPRVARGCPVVPDDAQAAGVDRGEPGRRRYVYPAGD